jgi:hypothetical protein
MAANSGSSASAIGFNQQSGGYYITLGDIRASALTVTEGTGSGGATTAPGVAAFAWTAANNAGGLNSTLVSSSGQLIRDMGRHVFSAGRAFRKFQAVNPAASLSTGGVSGTTGTGNAGYLTFYLEVPKGGLGPNGASVAAIAKYS